MVGEIREPTAEERERIARGPRYRRKPAPGAERDIGLEDYPRPVIREGPAPPEEAFPVYPEELIDPEAEYIGDARDLIAGWIEAGYWSEEVGLGELELIQRRIRGWWEEVEGRRVKVGAEGLHPKLPLYYQIMQYQKQARITGVEQYRIGVERQKTVSDYLRVKARVLASDMSYSEKLKTLLGAHPQGGLTSVFREIRADVWGSLSPAEQKRQTDISEGRIEAPRITRFAPRYAYPEPVRYERPFEEMRVGLAPQPWKDWFEGKFGTLIRRFKAVTEEPTEVGWAEYLKGREAELKEEWWTETATRRAARARVYAQKIKTVGF